MSRRTALNTATVPQKEDDPYLDYEEDEDRCSYCDGEGGDPLNDFCLPCPACGQ